MKYSENEIAALRETVCKRLSEKRFSHTLGVEAMAIKIGEKCMPESIDRLRVAALLHDISKEYSEAERFSLINKHKIRISDSDRASEALWHSLTAPYVIADEFPLFADGDVLSAVRNHTTGDPDMSDFDEIICLADYIEEGRSYRVCIDLREKFLAELDSAKSRDAAIAALHRATAISIDNTIRDLTLRGRTVSASSVLARDAILAKTERQ